MIKFILKLYILNHILKRWSILSTYFLKFQNHIQKFEAVIVTYFFIVLMINLVTKSIKIATFQI